MQLLILCFKLYVLDYIINIEKKANDTTGCEYNVLKSNYIYLRTYFSILHIQFNIDLHLYCGEMFILKYFYIIANPKYNLLT